MKIKILFLLVFIFHCSFLSKSQSLGVHAGLTMSKFYKVKYKTNQSSWYDETSSKYGYSLGFSYDINLSPKSKFSVIPIISYSRIGTKYEIDYLSWFSPNGFPSTTIDLDYIQLGALLGYNIVKQLQLNLGTQIEYLLDGTKTWHENKKLDFGLRAGASYTFFSKIGIGVNFYNGFTNVQELGIQNSDDRIWGVKNQSWTFEILYRI